MKNRRYVVRSRADFVKQERQRNNNLIVGRHRSPNKTLKRLKGVLHIVGWAEQVESGWIAKARDDLNTVHRAACVRSCQQDAIRTARSMVNILRQEQVRNRRLVISTYQQEADEGQAA